MVCCFVFVGLFGGCFLSGWGFFDFMCSLGFCFVLFFCIEAACVFLLKFYFSLDGIFFLLGNEMGFFPVNSRDFLYL